MVGVGAMVMAWELSKVGRVAALHDSCAAPVEA